MTSPWESPEALLEFASTVELTWHPSGEHYEDVAFLANGYRFATLWPNDRGTYTLTEDGVGTAPVLADEVLSFAAFWSDASAQLLLRTAAVARAVDRCD